MAFAGDPGNAPHWYTNIKSAQWETPPPIHLGSRIAFVAQFLGRRIAYTYEVTELEPGRKLVMQTAKGPVSDADHLHLGTRRRRSHPHD